MAVAFALGAAITWFLTVKRVTQTVPTQGAGVGDVDQGGGAMDSSETHDLEGQVVDGDGQADGDSHDAAEAVDDGSDDASSFGGERTSASASARGGWDHDAEDIDALLSDDEKSHAEKAGGKTSGEGTSGEETPGHA